MKDEKIVVAEWVKAKSEGRTGSVIEKGGWTDGERLCLVSETL